MVHIIKDVQNALGTFVTITIVHRDVREGISAIGVAFDEVHRIHHLMNVHEPGSEVGVLNREGYYDRVSDDTRYVIQRANSFSELSEGAFDITIFPVLELWKENASRNKIPTDEEISQRLGLVNYRDILIEGKKVSFRKRGMRITLAGVAKGYAVDRAIEALARCNIRHALVNAGGDIRVIGGKGEDIPWKIAIRDPRNHARIVTTVELVDRAIATSGTYRRSFSDILNPRAGKPVQGMLSSTVIAKKAMDADMLATGVFVLGTEKGIKLGATFDGVETFIIGNDGRFLN
ncbi:MAG TPA: FAD:protein FMN transferase [Thermodesulfobacteriota bacterium]|nr:FAD:protein FMN transferase [Thermodesulfobacteriota bacterium]